MIKAGALWRRIIAGLVDIALLWVILLGLLILAGNPLSALGAQGIWIGFGLAFLYYWLGYSPACRGGTAGAWLVGLRAVSPDGQPLDWLRAAFRSFIVTLCWFSPSLLWGLAGSHPVIAHPFTALGVQAFGQLALLSFLLGRWLHPSGWVLVDGVSGSTMAYRDDPEKIPTLQPPGQRRAVTVGAHVLLFVVIAVWQAHGWKLPGQNPWQAAGRYYAMQRWLIGNSPFDATIAIASRQTPHGLESQTTVPTLTIAGWTPPALFTSPIQRDYAANRFLHDLHKNYEWTEAFKQIELHVISGVHLGLVKRIESVPFYRKTAGDANVAQYYADRSEVVRSTDTVLRRYNIVEVVPPGWVDRLYRQRDFSGIETEMTALWKKKQEDQSWLARHLFEALTHVSDQKDFTAKAAILDDWIATSPQSSLAYALRGRLYEQLAWRLRGAGVAAHVDRSQWKPFEENIRKAKSDLLNAAQLDPTNVEAYTDLIGIALALGETRETQRAYYNQAVAAAPWALEPHWMYFRTHQPQWGGSLEAEQQFANQVAKKESTYPLFGILRLYAMIEEANRTEDKFAHYARPDVWNMIHEIYSAILSRYPDMLPLRAEYTWFAYKTNHFEEAVKQFDILGDRYSSIPTYWRDLSYYNISRAYAYQQKGWAYLQKNDLEQGMPWLLKAQDYNPFDPWPMAKLAECYRRQNKPAEARVWAEKTLQNKPSNLDKRGAESVLQWVNSKK